MLHVLDIPTDSEKISEDTEMLACEDSLDMANVGVILGQLDPTEVDTKTMTPRWDEDQRALIIKFNDALREWRE
jgi:hypothetical protein